MTVLDVPFPTSVKIFPITSLCTEIMELRGNRDREHEGHMGEILNKELKEALEFACQECGRQGI